MSRLEGIWSPSKFNFYLPADNGNLYFYNSYVGALAIVPKNETSRIKHFIKEGFSGFPKGILADLCLNGFFVPEGTDEPRLAEALHQRQFSESKILELILLPNENCNFRCKYCYEDFKRNKMEREVIEGIIKLVQSRVSNLSLLRIGWFGGEPLTAKHIIKHLSERLQEICQSGGCDYTSSMTTNGYLLNKETAKMLFQANIRRFQITLDGPREQHNRLRVLADGSTGTFDRIFSNLKMLRNLDETFKVVIRVNFNRSTTSSMKDFLELLKNEFGNDGRFCVDFHPIGAWGEKCDSQIADCESDEGRTLALQFSRMSAGAGFDLLHLRNKLKPFGSVCYAANPFSYIIGANGNIYKCTVAFNDYRNRVGYLSDRGELHLDENKMAMWISNGEEKDSLCQSCPFRPACQGNACPLGRLNSNRPPCPPSRVNLPIIMDALIAQMIKPPAGCQTML
jgi:uncharacterized protein